MARDRLAALRTQQAAPVEQEAFPTRPDPPRRPTLSHRLSFEDTHEVYTAYASPSPEFSTLGTFSNPFNVPPAAPSPPRAPPQAALPSRRTSDPFGTPRASEPVSTFDNYSMSSRGTGMAQRKTHTYQTSISHHQATISPPPPFSRRDTAASSKSGYSSYSDASDMSVAEARLVPVLGQAYGLGMHAGVDTSMESFFGELSIVQSETRDFDDALTRIEALHQRELSTIAESPESQRVSTELQRVTQEATRLSSSIKQRIQQLERTNGLGRDLSNSEKNVKRTQTAGVKNRFVTAIQRYSSIEASHRAACRQRLARQYRVVKPSASDDEIRQAIEDPQAGIFTQATLASARTEGARAALTAVQARQADLVRIEETISELAQLFNDMAYMVEEQHEAIVDIEEKGMKVEQDMEYAHRDLVTAKHSAKAARNKRKWCFIIAVIVLLIVGIIVTIVLLKNNGVFDKKSGSTPSMSEIVTSTVGAAVQAQTSAAALEAETSVPPALAVVTQQSTTVLEVTRSMTRTVWATATATTTRAVVASASAVVRGVAANGA